MSQRHKQPRPTPGIDEARYRGLVDELAGSLKALLAIEGVEGVGQPVTVLSPGDLPPHLLGFVELLRAGAVEDDEEMVILTIAMPRRRRKEHHTLERVRQALLLLCRYAQGKGTPIEEIEAVLDEARRGLRSRTGPRGRGR